MHVSIDKPTVKQDPLVFRLQSDRDSLLCQSITIFPYRRRLADAISESIYLAMNPFNTISPNAMGNALVEWLVHSLQPISGQAAFASIGEQLVHLIQTQTLGRGATTVAFAPLWKPDRLSTWINQAWDGIPLQEWQLQCRPIIDSKRTRHDLGRQYSVDSTAQWPVIVKISETQDFLDKTRTIILWKHDLPYANRSSSKPHPLLEVVTYSLVQRILAPMHPGVCAFSFCFPAPILPIERNKMSMLKVEEYISGVSLSRLFRDPSYAKTRKNMSIRDVLSMMGQSILLQIVQQLHTHILHRDVHAGNMIVQVLHEPFALAYNLDEIKFQCHTSPFLLVRFDWSEAIPYMSFDPLTVKTELAVKASLLGHHSRRSALTTDKLVKYPMPLWSDLTDIMSEWLELLHDAKDLPFDKSRLVRVADAILDSLALACVCHDLMDARNALTNVALVEGGWAIPSHWLDLNDSKLIEWLKHSLARMDLIWSTDEIETLSFDCMPSDRPIAPLSESWDDWIHSSPHAILTGGQEQSRESLQTWQESIRSIVDTIRHPDKTPSQSRNRLLETMQRWWQDMVRAPNGRDLVQLSHAIDTIVDTIDHSPPYSWFQGLACEKDEEKQALELYGMTPVRWTQLVNAASRLARQPYVYTNIVQTKYKQTMNH